MLAPNKQNLLIVKSQLKLVNNGMKLLKEKRSGLIFTFLDMARKGKVLEQNVSKEIQIILSLYESSLTFTSSESLILALENIPTTKLSIEKKRISGVYVDLLKIIVKRPVRKFLKPSLKISLDFFANYFPILLELTQMKLNTKRIASEILKVNRQISNLERKVEDILAQIKYIQNSLMEKENFEKSVLIKQNI
jgi:vacuolar-type H+-ATPase subunit D/Vma8